jgi:hypothetical protein
MVVGNTNVTVEYLKVQFEVIFKMHSHCFGIMGGRGNFAFNLVVKLSVELGYIFLILSLKLRECQCLMHCCPFY